MSTIAYAELILQVDVPERVEVELWFEESVGELPWTDQERVQERRIWVAEAGVQSSVKFDVTDLLRAVRTNGGGAVLLRIALSDERNINLATGASVDLLTHILSRR